MDLLPDVGHACGHNLIASISLGATYCLKSVKNKKGLLELSSLIERCAKGAAASTGCRYASKFI